MTSITPKEEAPRNPFHLSSQNQAAFQMLFFLPPLVKQTPPPTLATFPEHLSLPSQTKCSCRIFRILLLKSFPFKDLVHC